jgi:hypothetical protein
MLYGHSPLHLTSSNLHEGVKKIADMKMKLLLLVLTVAMPLTVLAQKDTEPVTLTPSVSYTKAQLDKMLPLAQPEDVSSPEAIIKALHDSVSGPQGDWNSDRFRSLCAPNVFFEYLDEDKDGTPNLSTVSMDTLADGFRKLHTATSWYETAGNLSVTRIENKQHRMMAIVNYTGTEGTHKNEQLPKEPTKTTTLLYLGDRKPHMVIEVAVYQDSKLTVTCPIFCAV